jgi:hypothetical protein
VFAVGPCAREDEESWQSRADVAPPVIIGGRDRLGLRHASGVREAAEQDALAFPLIGYPPHRHLCPDVRQEAPLQVAQPIEWCRHQATSSTRVSTWYREHSYDRRLAKIPRLVRIQLKW